MLAQVRAQAVKLGANAVLTVRKQFKRRVQVLAGPFDHDSYPYSATVFTGVAVCLAPLPEAV